MDSRTIEHLAPEAGLGVEPARMAERRAFLDEPLRSTAACGEFPPDFAERVAFMRRAKALGFSMDQTRHLLSLWRQPGSTRADVRRRAAARIAHVDREIAELRRLKHALRRIMGSCRGDGPVRGCALLNTLGGNPAPVDQP